MKLGDYEEFVKVKAKEFVDAFKATNPPAPVGLSSYKYYKVYMNKFRSIAKITGGEILGPVPPECDVTQSTVYTEAECDPTRYMLRAADAVYPFEGWTDKLKIEKFDIRHVAWYLSNKSDYYQLASDFNSIYHVEEADIDTLCIGRNPNSIDDQSVRLQYNSHFIGKAIFQDYCKFYNGDGSFRSYKGSVQTLAYLVGHELYHYRYDHFNPRRRTMLFKNSIGLPNQVASNCVIQEGTALSKYPKYLYKQLLQLLNSQCEKMCNQTMNRILDTGVTNTGFDGSTRLGMKYDEPTYIDGDFNTCTSMEFNLKREIDTSVWAGSDSKSVINLSHPLPTYEDILFLCQMALHKRYQVAMLKSKFDDYIPPKQPRGRIMEGMLVKIRKSQKIGVVTKAGAPNPDTGVQDVQVRPLSPAELAAINDVLARVAKAQSPTPVV